MILRYAFFFGSWETKKSSSRLYKRGTKVVFETFVCVKQILEHVFSAIMKQEYTPVVNVISILNACQISCYILYCSSCC